MPEHPSGQQFQLRHGEHKAVITEVGAGIRSYTVGGVPVLDGFEADQMCDGARGQSLLPWPNRIADGSYEWDGAQQQLPLTEPNGHNAIHGLTRWANWELLELTDTSVHLRHHLRSQTGWPFLLRCDIRYSLNDGGLTVRTTARNTGPEACPFAAGAHPYLSAGTGIVDDCELVVPADTWLPTDQRGIPTGAGPVDGTTHDFRQPRAIGQQHIDVSFTDLRRDPDGRATVELRRAGTGAQLWAGPGYPYLEIFTGDTLAPARRRRGLGVEPMTAPPNAFQTGTDLITLQPGDAVDLSWGLRPL